MNDFKKALGARIQEIRKKRGLKQAEMSEMLDIDPKHLSKIECGHSFPSMELLTKISKSLDIKPYELMKTEHFKDKKTLIAELTNLLKKAKDEEIITLYRIAKDIIN